MYHGQDHEHFFPLARIYNLQKILCYYFTRRNSLKVSPCPYLFQFFQNILDQLKCFYKASYEFWSTRFLSALPIPQKFAKILEGPWQTNDHGRLVKCYWTNDHGRLVKWYWTNDHGRLVKWYWTNDHGRLVKWYWQNQN